MKVRIELSVREKDDSHINALAEIIKARVQEIIDANPVHVEEYLGHDDVVMLLYIERS